MECLLWVCLVIYVLPQSMQCCMQYLGIIFRRGPANERRCYIVTLSLIGWAHAQNDPLILCSIGLHHNGTRLYFTVTSREHHGDSNHQHHRHLFYSLFRLTLKKKIKAPHNCLFVRRIHWWLENYLHKVPVMWKAFPFPDEIMGRFHDTSVSVIK